jgi:hypothetical protein
VTRSSETTARYRDQAISQSSSALNLTDQGYFGYASSPGGIQGQGSLSVRFVIAGRYRSSLCKDAEVRLADTLRCAFGRLFSGAVSLGLD